MADHGTVTLLVEPADLAIDAYSVILGLALGSVVLSDSPPDLVASDYTLAGTVSRGGDQPPTTGQLWPRGNPL